MRITFFHLFKKKTKEERVVNIQRLNSMQKRKKRSETLIIESILKQQQKKKKGKKAGLLKMFAANK